MKQDMIVILDLGSTENTVIAIFSAARPFVPSAREINHVSTRI